MTITPEKLRELAAIEAADQFGRPDNVQALRAAADEIARLSSDLDWFRRINEAENPS